jgi:metal-responsive CopG/Arc/MetJ family transcriptional regulator
MNFMKKVIFDISDELSRQIKDVMRRAGFSSRSEFFRYLAINFIQQNTGEKYIEREDEEEPMIFNIPKDIIRKVAEEAGAELPPWLIAE